MRVSVEKPGSPEEVLAHFGKKGMRWGVRKKQEASNQKSVKSETSGWSKKKSKRVENRAKGHDSEAKKAQVKIDQIKANPSTWVGVQRRRNLHVNDLEQYRDVRIKAAKDLRAGHLTDFQKKVVIGTSVAATVLATYGTYKLVDSGTARQIITRNSPFKKNDLLSRTMSPDAIMRDVVKPINPRYGELGTKNNCRRATFAYEMRRRGMDVKATKTVAGTGQTVTGMLNATDPKAKFKTGKLSMMSNVLKEKGDGPVSRAVNMAGGTGKEPIGKWSGFMGSLVPAREKSQTVFEALSEHPNGARGELGVRWRGGGAHSMAWEVIGGKPHIFDAQSGVRYTQAKFHQTASMIEEVGMTRLDNIPLNQNFLKRWVTNA